MMRTTRRTLADVYRNLPAVRVYHSAHLCAGTIVRRAARHNNRYIMKLIGGLVSLLVAMAIGLGIYYIFLKQASPAGGGTATTVISTTRVEMDLSTIANAERSYYAQNSSYGTIDQLVTGGELPVTLSGRDGYTYTMDASSSGFTVRAKWSPQTPEQQMLHAPTVIVDQTNQVRLVQ